MSRSCGAEQISAKNNGLNNADLLDLIPCDIIKRLRANKLFPSAIKKDVRNVNSGVYSLLCNLYILVGSADVDPRQEVAV